MNNVLHLSAYDYGGAGKAAYRLHWHLRDAGLNSKMLVFKKSMIDEDVVELNKINIVSQLKRVLSKVRHKLFGNTDYHFQNQNISLLNLNEKKSISLSFKPDLLVVHWVSGFISFTDIKSLSDKYNVPVVFYLMDMASLTGGCHYAWECKAYMHQCGFCPALCSSKSRDISSATIENKHHALKNLECQVLAASGLLHKQAKSSILFQRANVETLLLSVSPDVFFPLEKTNRNALKKSFGLSLDKKVIFFGSQGLELKRKGMKLLYDALKILSNQCEIDIRNIVIMVAGKVEQDLDLPFETKLLGFLDGDKLLAEAYQVADLFVCPSIEDSGPMMINESIMCGTPVVAFDMGVANDLIITKETGYVAELGNSSDLAKGIAYLLSRSSTEMSVISKKCHDIGMKKCHPDVQTKWFTDKLKQLTISNGRSLDV
tara:strand:+ start:12039 stop:13328 length:1290 start_codon:yes stop_codon:yes gene_type:complete